MIKGLEKIFALTRISKDKKEKREGNDLEHSKAKDNKKEALLPLSFADELKNEDE